MRLQSGYSRRLSWIEDEAGDSAGQGSQSGPAKQMRGQRSRGGNRNVVLFSGGLFVAAGLGAGVVIFPDGVDGLWKTLDWLAPSSGSSALIRNGSLASPVQAANADKVPAKTLPPRAAPKGPPAAEPEPVLIKAAVVSPTTTSSVSVAPEPAKEPVLPPVEKTAKEAGPAEQAASAPPIKVAAAPPASPSVTLPRAEPEPSFSIVPEVTETLRRARMLIERGDIAGARLLLEHAAAGKDPRATMALAETYDPAMLARWGARGIKGDAAKARALYEKAAATGFAEARARVLAVR